jgi:hypothetical protein
LHDRRRAAGLAPVEVGGDHFDFRKIVRQCDDPFGRDGLAEFRLPGTARYFPYNPLFSHGFYPFPLSLSPEPPDNTRVLSAV